MFSLPTDKPQSKPAIFGPLVDVVGVEGSKQFEFIGMIRKGDELIFSYRHILTRQCVYLDEEMRGKVEDHSVPNRHLVPGDRAGRSESKPAT